MFTWQVPNMIKNMKRWFSSTVPKASYFSLWMMGSTIIGVFHVEVIAVVVVVGVSAIA